MKIKITNKRNSTYTLDDATLIRLGELKRILGISKSQIIELLVKMASVNKTKKDVIKSVKSKFQPEEIVLKAKSYRVIQHAKKDKK